MKKIVFPLFLAAIAFLSVSPAGATDDLAKRMSDLLLTAPTAGHWQVKTADVAKMIDEKKGDFLIVDVRPTPPGQAPGRIAGSVYIPYNQILTSESLARLPKDKKIILVCGNGQIQNLPVLALRTLGYDAYTMTFGLASWINGYRLGKLVQDAVAAANYPFEAVDAAQAAPTPTKAPASGGYGK